MILYDIAPQGKRVLIRVDYNVPVKNGKILDDTRIRESLPTIKFVTEGGGVAVLISHLGRPKGTDKSLSLQIVADHMRDNLRVGVTFIPECVGEAAAKAVKSAKPGEIVLLENLRFHNEEEGNDDTFGKALAGMCDAYINDAFSVSHRAHASVHAVVKHAKSACFGFLVEKEVTALSKLLSGSYAPMVCVLGGAKVSDKIQVVQNLLKVSSHILIGGGMAFTFMKAQGKKIGKSLVENDYVGFASECLASGKIRLPVDFVCAENIDSTKTQTAVGEIPDNLAGFDIGKDSTFEFAKPLQKARAILWNGPMGVFEKPQFADGTLSIAITIATSGRTGAMTVAGGGETVAAINKASANFDIRDGYKHISTAGGAFLEFIEGKELPGIRAIEERNESKA